MVSGTIVHSCVSVNTVLCLVGILILGRVQKCMGEEQGSRLSALLESAREGGTESYSCPRSGFIL